MAYTVYNNDGSVLINLAAGDVDTDSTSLDLIGKNVNNYGEYINNNFVKLLTNFSNTAGPRSPKRGQLWYDSANNTLNVYNGSSWSSLLNALVTSIEPSHPTLRIGEFWFDSSRNQLNVFNGTSFKLIGPAVDPLYGKFGVEPPPYPYEVRDGSDNVRSASVVYSYGTPMIVLSSATFTSNVATSLRYFSTNTQVTIDSGTNILTNLSVNNDLIVRGSITSLNGFENTPLKNLTASYNSGWIGGFTWTYTVTNTIIRTELLPYLFSTSTNTWTSALEVGSEVKVILTSGTFTTTEVRHFILQDAFGTRSWQPYEIYPATGTNYQTVVNTYTNVVRIA